VNKRSGDSFSSGTIEKRADTTKTTDMVEARFRKGRNLVRESKVMVEDETQITCSMRRLNISLTSCWGRPRRMNSVLEGLRVRRLADIQSEILCSARRRESDETC